MTYIYVVRLYKVKHMQPLHVSDHVSHPYKTKGTIMVLHILIFMYLHSKCEDINLLKPSYKFKLLYN